MTEEDKQLLHDTLVKMNPKLTVEEIQQIIE